MTDPIGWLELHGKERERAVDEAFALLTNEYRRKYPMTVPPELHRLSAIRSAKIVYIDHLEGGARLLPVSGGFEILVDSRLGYPRARTCIAHELVHTLFYSNASAVPKRIIRATPAEEHFCFDVGRRILAPLWMIELTGIPNLRDGSEMFNGLLKTFRLSRPVAGRLLLQDYQLSTGVAALWSRSEGFWSKKRGSCLASPSLSRAERTELHDRARHWLAGQSRSQFGVSGVLDRSRNTAFVLVIKTVLDRTPLPAAQSRPPTGVELRRIHSVHR